MDFKDIKIRIMNMIAYGVSKEDIINTLTAEGIPEDIIFLAYVAAIMADEFIQSDWTA